MLVIVERYMWRCGECGRDSATEYPTIDRCLTGFRIHKEETGFFQCPSVVEANNRR